MAFDDDPLEKWLYWSSLLPPKQRGSISSEVRKALARLEDHLRQTTKGKAKRRKEFWLSIPSQAVLPPEDLTSAQRLYLRLVEIGGPGSTHTQKQLLDLLGWSALPAAVPFWIELLDLRRPRDHFTRQRQIHALSALAYLVLREDDSTSRDALIQATHHATPEVRGQALRYLVVAHREADRPLSAEVIARTKELSTGDRHFVPRFIARRVLFDHDLPLPLDNPCGVYSFKVTYQRDQSLELTVELGAKQTLDHLHAAILRGLDWDDDHLYAIYMDGVLPDDPFVFNRPFEEGDPPFANEMAIGELGLSLKDTFLYLFDFGDNHQFDIEVKDIRDKASSAKLPRVAKRSGRPPPQYPAW